MNWVFYLGSWWSVRVTGIKNTFDLIAFGNCSILRVTKDMLRVVVRNHWGSRMFVS